MTLNKNTVKKIITILLCTAAISGCSTQEKKDTPQIKSILKNFSGEPVVPREANRIMIPDFINRTSDYSVSQRLTIKLRDKINLDGRLAVVSLENEAELLAEGTVLEYQVQPLEFNATGKPIIKRLRIIASLKLINLKKDKEIFFQNNIQAFEKFSDVVPPIMTEMQTQDKVLDDLSDRLTLKIIDGWYTKLLTPLEKGKQ